MVGERKKRDGRGVSKNFGSIIEILKQIYFKTEET